MARKELEGDLRFVKFVVHPVRGVIFGEKDWPYDRHRLVANNNGIDPKECAGGGFADMQEKRIFGSSEAIGPYDKKMVESFLPDWHVDPSSNEKPED